MTTRLIRRILFLTAICYSAVSCLKGKGFDEELTDNTDLFSASVSPTVIAADGKDAATFDIRFRGTRLTADDVVFYNADDNTVVEMPDMQFTTEEQGVYRFYVTYENVAPQIDEEESYTSEIMEITATNSVLDLEPNGQKGLTASLSTTVVQTGEDRAIFIVRYDGEVLNGGYDIYDLATNTKVSLPTMSVTSASGTVYELPYYSTSEAGNSSFWIAYKTHNTSQTPLSVTAVDFEIPTRPVDPQPDNLQFKHRSMIMQFTGLGCGYCPYMIAALRDVLADEDYGSKAVLAAAHTYSGDPYAPTDRLDYYFNVNDYPTVIFDMMTKIQNYGYSMNVSNIKKCIDTSLSTAAQAGISARMAKDDNTLIVRMTVKAATSNSFRVGVWVLENGLTGTQANYGMEGEFNTHDNVVRVADSKEAYSNSYAGHDIGYLNAGDTSDYVFVIPLDAEWVHDNCHLLLFVSALDGSSYTVTNAVATRSLTDAVTLEYE